MRRESHVRFCEGPGVQFPRATRVRPAWALTGRCKSSGKQVVAIQGKGKVSPARVRLEEARNEAASGRTETRYEAVRPGASVLGFAKLPRPRGRAVDRCRCAAKVSVLTWGDLASCLKG